MTDRKMERRVKIERHAARKDKEARRFAGSKPDRVVVFCTGHYRPGFGWTIRHD